MKNMINIYWDSEATVYVATSDVIPGRCYKAESFDELMDQVQYNVPRLIQVNKKIKEKDYWF